MSTKRTVLTGIAGAALAGGSLLAAPAIASASVRPHSFANAQAQLERQLTNRSAQLGRLSADVSAAVAAKSLTPAHATVLNASIATATANITSLTTSVEGATTGAELRADSASMVKQNRVYA